MGIKPWSLVRLHGKDTELVPSGFSLFWDVQHDMAVGGFCKLDADFSFDQLNGLEYCIQSLWMQIPVCDSKMWCRIVIFKLCAYEDHFYDIHNYLDHHTIIDLPSFSTDEKHHIYIYRSISISIYLYISIIRTSTKCMCNVVITIPSQSSIITTMYVWEMEFIQSIKSSELSLTKYLCGKQSANYALDIISVHY